MSGRSSESNCGAGRSKRNLVWRALYLVAAAGIYLVPPVAPGAPFPGAEIFQPAVEPAPIIAAGPARAGR